MMFIIVLLGLMTILTIVVTRCKQYNVDGRFEAHTTSGDGAFKYVMTALADDSINTTGHNNIE
eukprot:scaffold169832_cov21-Prasinocladus_malaysianus.AAC.1